MKYKITITKTSDGRQDYMQVISADQFSTNIVLIGEFEVLDTRHLAILGFQEKEAKKKK